MMMQLQRIRSFPLPFSSLEIPPTTLQLSSVIPASSSRPPCVSSVCAPWTSRFESSVVSRLDCSCCARRARDGHVWLRVIDGRRYTIVAVGERIVSEVFAGQAHRIVLLAASSTAGWLPIDERRVFEGCDRSSERHVQASSLPDAVSCDDTAQ